MKKIIMLFMLLLAFTGAFAQKKKTTKPAAKQETAQPAKQEASKPTKEQTMDWIAEKMKENLKGKDFDSYSNGVFKYKNDTFIFTLDLNKVTGISSEYSDDFFVSGKRLVVVTYLENGKEYSADEFVSIGGDNYNKYRDNFNFKTDTALLERLRKAFDALVAFNSTKKSTDPY
jgi:hypothetical protein